MADQHIPQKVGVLGGGRMGSGIAHAFVMAGSDVVVVEQNDEFASAANDRVTKALQASIDRQKTEESFEALTGRLGTSVDFSAFAGAGLVVEAVPEDPELKREALRNIEAQLDENAFIATNTSSLSVDGLAKELARPERFCGLHFFNPVPASGLVEVVIGEQTGEELKTAAPEWVRELGKAPVVVTDAPGFASSRLGVAIGLEAIRMVEEGVASVEDIDAAMVLGYKYPVGPLKLTDMVGLDVRLGIAEYLASTLGPRFEPPQLMRDMVERGELGQKSGQGFYTW